MVRLEYRYDISSIIVSYNCLDSLKECVDSLRDQDGPTSEIIVIDNDSHDATASFLKTQPFKKILPGRNLGFSRAVNLGARQAEGRYLLILNPDTVLPARAFRQLQAFADSQPDFGLVSPVLVHPNGHPQLSARTLPRRRDFLFGRGSPMFRMGLSREKKGGYIDPDHAGPVEVPAVSATALFVRAELFQKMRGFDERFFMYLEDLDLCKRIRQIGLKIWILPGIQIVHGWRASSRKRPFFALYQHHLSIYRYFRKHYPSEWCPNVAIGIALAAGFIINSLLVVFRKRG